MSKIPKLKIQISLLILKLKMISLFVLKSLSKKMTGIL